jgi:type VI secretion system protein ImpA
MTSPSTLDLDQLLAPIAPDRPTGVYLRGDESTANADKPGLALYYDLRTEYGAARAAERKYLDSRGLPATDPNSQVEPPDWGPVKKLAVTLLAKHSKDLWGVARLIEAAFQADGFPGLRDALQAGRQLCETYWKDLYPPHTPATGFDERVDDFVGQLLSNPNLLRLPILRAPLTGRRGYSLLDFQKANELEALKTKNPKVYEQRKSKGEATLGDFQTEVKEEGAQPYHERAAAIRRCIEELDGLQALLEDRCAADEAHKVVVPSVAEVRSALESCEQAVNTLAPPPAAAAAAATAADPSAAQGSNGQPAAPKAVSVPGAIGTRAEAFQALEQVAKFFEQAEPQSFIPYSQRQNIRRGGLTLPELLTELITSDDVRRELARQTGLPAPEKTK